MFGSRDINLSESVVASFETVRRALEIRFGSQISFVGSMRITPDNNGRRSESEMRRINFETTFVKVGADNPEGPKTILAMVRFVKSEGHWVFSNADLYIGNRGESSVSKKRRYHVRHAMEHPFDTRLYIASTEDSIVCRGHNLGDRVEGPLRF